MSDEVLSLSELRFLRKNSGGGNLIHSRKGIINFITEFEKIQASKAVVWKYHGSDGIVDKAMEHAKLDIITENGTITSHVIIGAGSHNLFILETKKRAAQAPYDIRYCNPELHYPVGSDISDMLGGLPRDLGKRDRPLCEFRDGILCMKKLPAPLSSNNVLIGTNEALYNVHFKGPVDYTNENWYDIHNLTSSSKMKIYAVDCNSDGSEAVIGTTHGAYLVNIETGSQECVCSCEDDVISAQFDALGHVMVCGLRNGRIMTLDTRQKPGGHNVESRRHQISFPLSLKQSERVIHDPRDQRFEPKGNRVLNDTIFLPSPLSWLASLKLRDQYFCARSMDGLIYLYDQRFSQTGPVLTYKGSSSVKNIVNFGIDPLEKILVSGGDDGVVRIWDINSGEVLFNCLIDQVPSVFSFGESRNGRRGLWMSAVEMFYMSC